MQTSRRSFLQMAWGTVVLVTLPLPALSDTGGGTGWQEAPGLARYRIEGIPKVRGEKIYARDFRARDMAGWPDQERIALVLRAEHADRCFQGYNADVLPPELRPRRVVTQADLDADAVANIFADTSPPDDDTSSKPCDVENRPESFMVGEGQIPGYLGQPLAILIFDDKATYRAARRILLFNDGAVRYGDPQEVPPYALPYESPKALTRYPGEDGADAFSQTKDGDSDPRRCGTGSDKEVPADCEAKAYREKIDAELAAAGEQGWTIYDAECATQVIDPMFMEPESGLAWLDGETLHLVLGTQSPNGDVGDALTMLGNDMRSLQVKQVNLTSCFPGGGFGGRDVSTFSPILMIAAAYAEGPVRIVHDRYQQFQAGIKQLGSNIRQRIAVDRDDRFQVLTAQISMPSGGKNNYSQFVADLAGYSAGGGYSFPRVAVDAHAQPGIGVIAGSMRGFGGTQAAFALEVLVDEIAQDRGLDPIALRRKNALVTENGDRTVTGAPLLEPMRIVEILDLAASHELWASREAEKARRSGDVAYGVGFALTNQAYGTGSDGVMAAVALSEDGVLTVHTNAVDMGNGSATTLALMTAGSLGSNAEHIDMGQVALFTDSLKIATDPSTLHPHRTCRGGIPHDVKSWKNPEYTASFSMSSSACITAFQQVHAVERASRVLYETGIWPAAAALWKLPDPGDPALMSAATWADGALTLEGKEPLSLSALAAKIYEDGRVSGAMVHAYFAGTWVSAVYPVGTFCGFSHQPRWDIDGLALRKAGQPGYQNVRRKETIAPRPEAASYGRSLYAPSATLAAVEVSRRTGEARVVALHTWLDAGRILQPQLVSGMYEGGAAMGIGYALLENLPWEQGGAGTGRWNLNRYHVALAQDVPLDRLTLTTLEPLTPDATAKGIAESVLCPIAPAIANAISHATGRRFRDLPLTPDRIKSTWGAK